jgi:hypothetical protein
VRKSECRRIRRRAELDRPAEQLGHRRARNRSGEGGAVLRYEPAGLPHPRRPPAAQLVEAEDVRLVARAEAPEVVEVVVAGGVRAGQQQRVDL